MGLARRALDEATKYALERKSFGVPIFEVSCLSVTVSAAKRLTAYSHHVLYTLLNCYSSGSVALGVWILSHALKIPPTYKWFSVGVTVNWEK